MISDEVRLRRVTIVEQHLWAEAAEEYDLALAAFAGRPRYEIVRTGQVLDGADEVLAYYQALRVSFPDRIHDNVRLHLADHSVIAEFDFFGTNLGEFHGLPPTGKALRVAGITVFVFHGQRLVTKRICFDAASLLLQIGRGDSLVPTDSGTSSS